MKRALVALIAGTVLSGFAAAYAATESMTTKKGAGKSELANAKTQSIAGSD
jgi:hypothetical protein